MELIERYVHDVGRRLPASTRADVRAELRELLGETLEARAAERGGAPDEATEVEVLREFGEPAVVAARYGAGEGGWVDPRFSPLFLGVCRIILAGAVLTVLFGMAFLLPSSHAVPEGAFRPGWLLPLLLAVAALGFTSFSWALVAFTAVERGELWRKWRRGPWDPRRLPPVRDPDAASRLDAALEILTILLMAYLANRFLPRSGTSWDGLLPMLNLLWAAQAVMYGVVLYQGRWRTSTRWVGLGATLFLIAILVRALAGNPLSLLFASSYPPNPVVREWISWFILINLRVMLAYSLFDAGLKLYGLLKRREPLQETPIGWAENVRG